MTRWLSQPVAPRRALFWIAFVVALSLFSWWQQWAPTQACNPLRVSTCEP